MKADARKPSAWFACQFSQTIGPDFIICVINPLIKKLDSH